MLFQARTAMLSTRRNCLTGAAMLAVTGLASAAREISIGVASTSLVSCAPRIAEQMGLFKKRGIQPRFVIMDSANTATAALISGAVKLAISGPGELVVRPVPRPEGGRGRQSLWLVSGNCGCFGGIPRASFITQPAGWWICGQHKRVAHNPTAATSAEAEISSATTAGIFTPHRG